MKKSTFYLCLTAILLNITTIMLAVEPPGIFDQDNPAFGTCNNDVPPEILEVKIEPPQPKSKEKIKIISKPWVDPFKSEAEIIKTSIFYSIDGMKTWEETASAQEGEYWIAEIGPFSPGLEVNFRVVAIDSEDNMAVEIPPTVTSFPPEDNTLFSAVIDGNDVPTYFPNNVDILDVALGFDDKLVYMKMTLEAKVSPTSGKLPNLYAAGFRYPDLRKNPITWNHELTDSRIMAYIPFISKIGFFENIMDVLTGNSLGTIKHKITGNSIYISSEIEKINRDKNISTETMKKEGFKFAAATIAVDLQGINTNEEIPDLNKIIKLADCTSFSIVYPKVHTITIKE